MTVHVLHFIQTYTTDYMTTDSAASATAYLCGVKTKYQALGVDNNVVLKDCSTVEGARVTSLLDWSLAEGKEIIRITWSRVCECMLVTVPILVSCNV